MTRDLQGLPQISSSRQFHKRNFNIVLLFKIHVGNIFLCRSHKDLGEFSNSEK